MNYQKRLSLTIGLSFFFFSLLVVLGVFVVNTPAMVSLTPQGNFHDRAVTVKLSSSSPFTSIYYTTDGSDPDPINDQTRIYTEPLVLEPPRVLLIKAVARSWSGKMGKIFTKTIFVDEDAHNRFHLPVVSISIDPKHLYDEEKGIFVEGVTRTNYLTQNPYLDHTMISNQAPANYNWRGRESERQAYFEYYKDKNLAIEQSVGLRVHGLGSRGSERKSFKLTARKNYDEAHGKFKNFFFEDYYTLAWRSQPITDFESLVVRRVSDDQLTFIRDEVGAEIFKQAGFQDYQPYLPVTAYFNGEYDGLRWLKPAVNEEFFMQRYGGADNNFHVLEVGDGQNGLFFTDLYSEDESYIQSPVDKLAMDHLNSLFAQDLLIETNYQNLLREVDVDNLLLYYALQVSVNNLDWPFNNYKLWRYRGEDKTSNPYLDGRWRWTAFDFDATFNLPLYDDMQLIENLVNVEGDELRRSFILQQLFVRKELRERFTNLCNDVRTNAMSQENLAGILDRLGELIKGEVEFGRQHGMYADYNNENQIKSFRDELLRDALYQTKVINNWLIENWGYSGETYRVEVIGDEGARAKLSSLDTSINNKNKLVGEYFVENSVAFSLSMQPEYELVNLMVNGQAAESQDFEVNYEMAKKNNGVVEISIDTRLRDENLPLRLNALVDKNRNDWLEFYNPNAVAINLEDYCLTDNPKKLCKWQLPKESLAGKSYWVFYSKDNKSAEAWRQYFFPFSLSSGEELILSKRGSGEVIDRITVPLMSGNQIYSYDVVRAVYRLSYL